MVPTGSLNVTGTVNLNYTGAMTNALLNVNGTLEPYGVYSASGNNPGGVFAGAGTLVVSPAFIITSEQVQSGTNVVVCWQSTVGYNYDVLTNGNLSIPAAWAQVNSSDITATSTTTCYTLPGATTNSPLYIAIRAHDVSYTP